MPNPARPRDALAARTICSWALRAALLFTTVAILTARPPRSTFAEEPAVAGSKTWAAVDDALRGPVERREIAGAVGLVLRDGEVVYQKAFGERDAERHLPMTRDTIFRIASMTKPITSTAVMKLVERGQLRLTDPVSRYIPSLGGMQVVDAAASKAAGTLRTVPAERPITIHDLLTHTSGIAYRFLAPEPLGAAYRAANVNDGLEATDDSLAQCIDRLAGVPLANQPGKAWQYGLSIDVLGRVVEVVSGKRLDDFCREEIFEPLRMRDTYFWVPADRADRVSALYRPGDDGKFVRLGDETVTVAGVTYTPSLQTGGRRDYCCGGGGLASTVDDYARFLQMLLGEGELDGARLLKPETVRLMTTNHIDALGVAFPGHGNGFGYGFGVLTPAGKSNDVASVGTYSWGGLFNTYFWVDPREKLIGIMMTQIYPSNHLSVREDFKRAVYAAIADENADSAALPAAAPGPRPGEVYREFSAHNGGNIDWRVTDPDATPDRARAYLPNPVLEITVDDLEGAVRAEALVDRWGGHLRTTDKRIRFNGNDWLALPDIARMPEGSRSEYYYSQDNPVVAVPLAHLQPGVNTFEGTCSTIDDYNWGQWGLYSLVLRVYYDPAVVPHPTGRITSPGEGATLAENPRISVEPSSANGVARVDVLAWYEGYDEDGDGRFTDWHRSYHQPIRGEPAAIRHHVGTVWEAPYDVPWDTRMVPDQAAGGIRLVARIEDSRGVWTVTEPVGGLSLRRRRASVALYGAAELPPRFGVRVGRTASCVIRIPETAPLDRATEAFLALRTWHGWDGHHAPLRLNGHEFPIQGKNHHFDFDRIPVPVGALRRGENVFEVHSETEEHMLEVLWPGPALIVRYAEQGSTTASGRR